MKKIFKIINQITFWLEWYLIIVTLVSFISIFLFNIAASVEVVFLFFLGSWMFISILFITVVHIFVVTERILLIFFKDCVSKEKLRSISICCIFGSISIVYLWFIYYAIQSL